MASFRKRGKKWEYRITWKTPDGKRKHKSVSGFRFKKSAEEAATKMETFIEKGGNPDQADILFLDYWDKWIAAYKSGNKSNFTEYRYSLIRRHLADEFAGRKLKSITGTEWQIFLNNLAAGKDLAVPKERSKDFISKVNGYVRSMVKSAINDQIIFRDFTYEVEVRGTATSNRIHFLEADDFKQVKQIAESRASFSNTGAFAVYIAAMTGMRLSEILGLTWKDIDDSKKIIHVNKAWDYSFIDNFKPTKTESSVRDIEVSQRVMDVFKKVHQEQTEMYLKTGYRDEKDLVIRGYRHNIITATGCNKSIRVIQEKIGIDKSKWITFHGLRHSHASYLISQGVDIYYISKRLGHASINITLKVYSHLLENQRKKEAEKSLIALDKL